MLGKTKGYKESDVLFLVHRMPYPPNKGDKIRSYHLLKHLAEDHNVHLGCFVDDADDLRHVSTLRKICKSVFVRSIRPGLARIKSMTALLTGEALSVHYYRDRRMQAWVERVSKDNRISSALAYSSPMAQFIMGPEYSHFPRIMDFVDVDSDKWRQYSKKKSGPIQFIYAREATKLEDFERRVSREFDASIFVSENEVRLFTECCPETREKQFSVRNGVATDFFDPQQDYENPFRPNTAPILFTGAMDYWPNVDAVTWFAEEAFPSVLKSNPEAEFWIVGGSPNQSVRSLATRPNIHVTGRVPDVRPYLKHARLAIAPLRIARGVQNKVLEAMAMELPVVCSPEAAAGLSREVLDQVVVVPKEGDFSASVLKALLESADPGNGTLRSSVLRHYDWGRNLSKIDEFLGH